MPYTALSVSNDAAAGIHRLSRTHVFHSWSAQQQINPRRGSAGQDSCFWDYEDKLAVIARSFANNAISKEMEILGTALDATDRYYTGA